MGQGKELEKSRGVVSVSLYLAGPAAAMRDTRRALTCGLAVREAAQWPD